MGYRSDIRIVLTEQDFNKLIDLLEKEIENPYLAQTFKSSMETMTTPDDVYVMFGVNDIKWYSSYPEVSLTEKFLNNHRHSFARIGEDIGDTEVNMLTCDEDGEDEEFYNFLWVQRDFDTDGFVIDR